jgi:hypothetical protein
MMAKARGGCPFIKRAENLAIFRYLSRPAK